MGSLIAQCRVHAVLVSLISGEKKSNAILLWLCKLWIFTIYKTRTLGFLVLKKNCENFQVVIPQDIQNKR